MGASILLITPDAASIVPHHDALIRAGLQVVVAEDAISALRLGLRLGVDLIIADADAEPLDGVAVAALMGVDRSTARVPVLVLSRRDDPGLRVRARDAGAAALLVRPLPSVLADCVVGHLSALAF